MAKKKVQKDQNKTTNATSHGVRYPWEDWLKIGKTKLLVKGKDYHGLSHGMAVTIRQAAKRKGLRVSLRVTESDVTVTTLEVLKP